eukprot:3870153-Pleurochrysis_carterae.AAC.3
MSSANMNLASSSSPTPSSVVKLKPKVEFAAMRGSPMGYLELFTACDVRFRHSLTRTQTILPQAQQPTLGSPLTPTP